MALAFDAAADGANTTGTSLTWTHAFVGSLDPILWVWCYCSGGDNVTGITFNGQALTQAVKLSANGAFHYLYFIVGQSGSHSVVISAGSSSTLYGLSASYLGAAQTGQPDATASDATFGSMNPYTVSLTTIADNCWTVLGLESDGNAAGTGGTGTTRRQVNSAYNGIAIYDSAAAITPAGSTSLNITGPTTGNAAVMASFAPAGVAAGGGPLVGGELGRSALLRGGRLVA